MKIRVEQVKSRQSSNVDTDTQNEIFDEPFVMEGLITLGKYVMNRFVKVEWCINWFVRSAKVTYVGQTGRLLNTRVKEPKKNLGRKCNYHYVLSDHRKEYVDHVFDWNNAQILHSENNKGKRELI